MNAKLFLLTVHSSFPPPLYLCVCHSFKPLSHPLKPFHLWVGNGVHIFLSKDLTQQILLCYRRAPSQRHTTQALMLVTFTETLNRKCSGQEAEPVGWRVDVVISYVWFPEVWGKWFLGIAPRVQHEGLMEQGTMSVPNGGIRGALTGSFLWVVIVHGCVASKSAPPAFLEFSELPNSFLKTPFLVEIVRVDFCCSQSDFGGDGSW